MKLSTWKRGTPKIAYVSGGGSGIGLQITKALLDVGASIAIFDLVVKDEVLSEMRQRCVGENQKVEPYLVPVFQGRLSRLRHKLQYAGLPKCFSRQECVPSSFTFC